MNPDPRSRRETQTLHLDQKNGCHTCIAAWHWLNQSMRQHIRPGEYTHSLHLEHAGRLLSHRLLRLAHEWQARRARGWLPSDCLAGTGIMLASRQSPSWLGGWLTEGAGKQRHGGESGTLAAIFGFGGRISRGGPDQVNLALAG
jgi:hypothetical protein